MDRPLVRFATFFFLLLLGFSAVSAVTGLQNHLHVVENAFASAAAAMANAAGSAAQVVNGNLILTQNLSLNINHECTGVFVLFVLVSFITAYPSNLPAKAIGILVGVTMLSFINVVRIATLVRVVEFYPKSFEYFHEYIWQGAFLMLVTLYAISWVEWARR